MIKRLIQVICFTGVLVLILFILFTAFKKEIANFYFSTKYENELNIVKDYLNIIVNGDINKLSEICDTKCRVLRSDYLNDYRIILKKIGIGSLKIDYADLKKYDDANRFFTIVYFGDNKKANIHIVLKKQNNKWIMMTFGMSEEFTRIEKEPE